MAGMAIDWAQVHQKSHSEVRARNASDRHSQNDFPSHRALPQMHDAGRNLGEKIEHRIATNGRDSGNVQAENEHGQQQYAAAQTRQPYNGSSNAAAQEFT